MKKLITMIILLVAVNGFSAEGWLTDFEEAKKQAAEKGLPILAEFAGLAWCPPCKALNKNVFQQQEFKEYAADHFVLFVADFPRPAPKDPTPIQQQNNKLAEHYGVQSFPTILLLNADGTVINQTGYKSVGPAQYIKHLESLLK